MRPIKALLVLVAIALTFKAADALDQTYRVNTTSGVVYVRGPLPAAVPVTVGTGTATAALCGVLSTSVTNSQTAADLVETDLWTYTLPANTLSTNGRGVRITVWGRTAANANTKTVRLYYGGSIVRTVVSSASNNEAWSATAIVLRTAASGQDNITTGFLAGTAFTVQNSLAVSNAANQIIKVTGQNGTASAGDIVFRAAVVECV